MNHRPNLARLLCIVLFSLLVSGCAPSTLFPDYWNKDIDPYFERSESPYVDSPDAVVVYDIEDLVIEKASWEVVRTHHVRIQIFTEAGKEYANLRLPFYHDESIMSIKAQTILPSGEVIKLKRSDVYEEGNKKGWRYKVFAMPGVEDQCIIEYQYQFRTERLRLIDPKFFQGYLHREYARFTLRLPQGFHYNGSVRNALPGYVEPETQKIYTPSGTDFQYIWEFNHIPNVRDEAYMYNRADHLFSVHMQLVRYEDQFNRIDFIDSWEDLAKEMMERYKSYLKPTRPLRKLLESIKSDDSDLPPSPELIHRFVHDKFTHKDRNSKWARYSNEVVNEMQATRVEKNLLLLGLLREAGYEADPILISRRSNGRISASSPTLNDFNHVIVRLKEGYKTRFIDVGWDYYPIGLMPHNSHSGQGLLLKKDESSIIDIPESKPLSKQFILSDCQLDEEGTLKGSFAIRSTDYIARNFRSSYVHAESDDKFAYKVIVDQFPGIVVDSVSYSFPMDDFTGDVEVTVHFQLIDFADFSGDMVYVPTTFFEAFKKNALVRKERNHNIEFSYIYKLQETVNLKLPKGYEVVEAPENKVIKGPGVTFRKLIQPGDGTVQFQWSYLLSELDQPPQNYELLKNFYTEAVTADQAKLVLSRKE